MLAMGFPELCDGDDTSIQVYMYRAATYFRSHPQPGSHVWWGVGAREWESDCRMALSFSVRRMGNPIDGLESERKKKQMGSITATIMTAQTGPRHDEEKEG